MLILCIIGFVALLAFVIVMAAREDRKPKAPVPVLNTPLLSDADVALLLRISLHKDYDGCAGKCGEDHGLPRDVTNATDLNYAAIRHLGASLGDRTVGIFAEYAKIT